MNRKISTVFLILLFFFAAMSAKTTAEESQKEGLFPTKKESSVQLNVTLNHDGIDSSSGKPTMSVNKTYILSVTIKVVKLGPDARDIHDIAILTEISTTNIFGSKSYYHAGLFSDKDFSLKEGESKTYDVEIMPVGPKDRVDSADLSVQVSVKEDVQFNVDPTTEFTPFTYGVTLNPEERSNPITSFDGNYTKTVSLVTIASKESRINFTLSVGADNNNTGKPQISSGKKYKLDFYFEVISLGPDADDVHNLEVEIFLEDESVISYFPGKENKKYYAMNLVSDTKMKEGDKVELHSVFYVASNVNDTTVKFKTVVKVKEAVSLGIDPTSEIANFGIEMLLNPSSATGNSKTPIATAFIIIPLVAIPLLRRRLKKVE